METDVRRDGKRNPEIRKISDRDGLGGLISNVETLAFGFYFLGDEPYAARAALLLRTWFLDPATRMNPHLEYGQAIPGVNQGRGIGIIETSGLVRLVDAVGLLEGSKAWTAADQQGLVAWFEAYLRWLRESRHGRDEAATTNNHGTHYDAQVASFALFTGQRSLAAAVLSETRQKRIAAHIQPDGRQPRELERTRAWSYSVMNLGGFFSLAALGERSGVDLWHYETPDGRSIRKALDWLLPFAQGEAWPYRQITPWSPKDLAPLLREAAVQYREPRYAALAVAGIAPDDRLQLLRHETPEGARLGSPRSRRVRRWSWTRPPEPSSTEAGCRTRWTRMSPGNRPQQRRAASSSCWRHGTDVRPSTWPSRTPRAACAPSPWNGKTSTVASRRSARRPRVLVWPWTPGESALSSLGPAAGAPRSISRRCAFVTARKRRRSRIPNPCGSFRMAAG